MILFVLSISLIVLGFGAVGMLAPLRLIKFVLWFDNLSGLYAAATFRIIFGLALTTLPRPPSGRGFSKFLVSLP